jgi:hypothetical protein
MFTTFFVGEKSVRGFEAFDDESNKFLFVPDMNKNEWLVYSFAQGIKFQLQDNPMQVPPTAIECFIEDHHITVNFDDGNGVFWYSSDMVHNLKKESL